MLSMITTEEQQYLWGFAKNDFTAKGEIVDLGCWMGASSVLLARGLRENTNPQTRQSVVHAYDRFIWEDWMAFAVAGTPLEGKYKAGESFFEECLARSTAEAERIKFYPGDAMEIGWKGSPIEFLFIDVMKSWELCNAIIRDFFPCLIPGVSTVVQQDFTHYYTYWIHLVMYRFREYFEPVLDIPASASLVFKYTRQIPAELMLQNYSVSSFPIEEITQAFEYSTSIVASGKGNEIRAAESLAVGAWRAANETI